MPFFGLYPQDLVLSSGAHWLPFCREVKAEIWSLILKAKCLLLSCKLLRSPAILPRHNEVIHVPVKPGDQISFPPSQCRLPKTLSQGAAPSFFRPSHIEALLLILDSQGGSCRSPKKLKHRPRCTLSLLTLTEREWAC